MLRVRTVVDRCGFALVNFVTWTLNHFKPFTADSYWIGMVVIRYVEEESLWSVITD